MATTPPSGAAVVPGNEPTPCHPPLPLRLPDDLHDAIAQRFSGLLLGPPAAAGGGRPPRRRKPRGQRPSRARIKPEVVESSSELSEELGAYDLFGAGGASGAGADGDAGAAAPVAGADEVDMRPGALLAVDKYADLMAIELVVVLSNEQRAPGSLSPIYRLAAVGGGAAIVLGEGEKVVVAWMTRSRGKAVYLCSCGGRGRAESLEVRQWLSMSTNCLHARALRKAFDMLVARFNKTSVDTLLEHHTVLDNSRTLATTEKQVFYATKSQKKRGLFAVLCAGTWSAVGIRPRVGKKGTKRRRIMRASCTRLSCNDHWLCKHAKAVNDWCIEAREAAEVAGGAGAPAMVEDADVILADPLGRRRQPVRTPAAQAAAQAEADARFSDESRWRAARNLLPCAGELDVCERYDLVADAGTDIGIPRLDGVLYEDRCFKCGAGYSALGIKNTGGTLHTLRGRVAVSMHHWECACGTLVLFDGAQHGLFASTTQTVFTRTLVDVVSQMVFTGHSTLSSAAGVLCFLLETTKALPAGRNSLSRQTLTSVVHRFSRTLIVPESLFRCIRCYSTAQRPYKALIQDGQVISVMQNQSEPLLRVTTDLTVTRMDTDTGCCLHLVAARSAVRKRCRAPIEETVRLNKDEFKALKQLMVSSAQLPADADANSVVSTPTTVWWACGSLFFSFFEIKEVVRQPTGQDVAVGGGGNDGAVDEEPLEAGAPIPVDHLRAAVAARRGVMVYECRAVDDAVGESDDASVARERWGVVRHFMNTFLAEPLVGAFTGLNRGKIKDLAEAMIRSGGTPEWQQSAVAVESVGIVWPFLRLIAGDDDADTLAVRAVGELLLFTDGVDAMWETQWRSKASEQALAFETQWRVTSVAKYDEWAALQPGATAPQSLLSSSPLSARRAAAQALETRTGHVFPDLDAIRPFITDSKADKINAERTAKAAATPGALERELNRVLGADDCRHASISSDVFMPGVENFLCPCGLLVGFDFLDKAESPAHVLATLVQRFPLLPKVVYFDTACQLARNAQRRLPWLLNISECACSVDRLHNVGDQHKCSCIFDANKFPSRSVKHRTACAESRHSLNKAFKTHLTHLRQDHFIVQMRILAAVINLRVMMRGAVGKETNHRLMAHFYHSKVVKHCERRVCRCANWFAWAAEAAVAQPAPAAGDGSDGGGDGGIEGGGVEGGGVGVGEGTESGGAGRGHEMVEGALGLIGGAEGGGGSVSSDAGSVRVEGGLDDLAVVDGPPLPAGVEVACADESESSDGTDSQSSAWESERSEA